MKSVLQCEIIIIINELYCLKKNYEHNDILQLVCISVLTFFAPLAQILSQKVLPVPLTLFSKNNFRVRSMYMQLN